MAIKSHLFTYLFNDHIQKYKNHVIGNYPGHDNCLLSNNLYQGIWNNFFLIKKALFKRKKKKNVKCHRRTKIRNL